MSSTNTTKIKRARSNPLLLPYLTPELWSKVLEGLPYGNMHELITSDDSNLAILSKAMSHVETIVVTRPEDLALHPPSASALAKVKKLTAVCWDDKEEEFIASLPGDPDNVPCRDLPIDNMLGQSVGNLIELISFLPNIETVNPVGFGGTGEPIFLRANTGPRMPEAYKYPDDLCDKMKAMCSLAKAHKDAVNQFSVCVEDVVEVLCVGYSSGKLPDSIILNAWHYMGKKWCAHAAALCCITSKESGHGPENPCSHCKRLTSLPFRMLLSIAKSRALANLCYDKDSILSVICKRPGGLDFMRDPTHMKEIIRGVAREQYLFSVDVACTKGGSPIVPGQNGIYVRGESVWARPPNRNNSYYASALCVPKNKLKVMVDLKIRFGGTIEAQYVVDMFYEAVEDSKDDTPIGTLCGKPFIMQDTVDALYSELGVTLPADKFIVFPSGAKIVGSISDKCHPEGTYWDYYDYNGEPPESEDYSEDEV